MTTEFYSTWKRGFEERLASIVTDESRNSLFDELGLKRLRESYMRPEETSPQQRYAYVSAAFASNAAHAQRLYDYSSKHWLGYSTPVLSFGKTKDGLPISCYLNRIIDSKAGLVDSLSESNWLSMLGGGVGLHVGLRGADDKSAGVMPHLATYDRCSLAYKQGTRRGSIAAYLSVDHPDIVRFIEMRKVTGDQNMKALNLNHGVNLTDKFMELIERCMLDKNADDSWDLIQPNTGRVVETVSARTLWQQYLELRVQTGEPYSWFIDTVNRSVPWFQKAMGLENHGGNLCAEISLVTNEERTAVCCLSSPNIEYYDEWKNDDLFLRDVLEMLDNVIEYFINMAPDTIKRARYSAMRERSVGIGAAGWHSYLQSKMIPFESPMAKSINITIFKHMREKLDKANYELAVERGACPDAAEHGVMQRCATTSAIAPTASNAIIMGNTSPCIEPYATNAFRQDTTSGIHVTRNKHLIKLIEEEGKKHKPEWIEDQWSDIIANGGSVQHLKWMDDYTKDVFKTFIEINQMWVVEQAADRQPFIDQAQSLNLAFRPDANIKYLHAVHFAAWKKGVKSLYYLRSTKLKSTDKVGAKVERKRIEDEIDLKTLTDGSSCIACE